MSGISDPIADMLTRIRNAIMAKHEKVTIPASNLKRRIAEILQEEGYVEGFSFEEDSRQGQIHVTLKYLEQDESAITSLNRISKPGRRVYADSAKLPQVRNGLGVAVISTSSGVMTDREARRRGIGGEVLCEVW